MPPSAAFNHYRRTATYARRNAQRFRRLCVLVAATGLLLLALVCLSIPT